MRGMWVLALACAYTTARASEPVWTMARSSHFEIYSCSDAQAPQAALIWFERLRVFFKQSGFPSDSRAPIRVVECKRSSEYDPFRLRPSSAAYYLGTETRDYIVMQSLGAGDFAVAAHEYAHFVLHAARLKLPLWLDEGLAEFFSSVRIAKRDCSVGGDRPERVATLRRESWLPIEELLTAVSGSATQTSPRTAPVFYAQSWALTRMLILSPDYSSRFRDVVAQVSAGASSSRVLAAVYHRPLDEIARDLRAWVQNQRVTPRRLPGVENFRIDIEARVLSQSEVTLLMADLSLANGELDRAQALYEESARQYPNNAEIWAALGAIAFRRGDRELARRNWKRAIDDGIEDAQLCFRYATLADDAGLGAEEIRPALQRAITLEPEFDDARYELALLESNTGRFEEAVAQLRAMRKIAGARAFGYWCTMSYAYEELGKREEAKQAAGKALEHASTAPERERAQRLAYVAATDFSVQFARDASGRPQLVTTRVPHDQADRNPFIEPDDRIEHAEGQLRAVNCDAGKATGLLIQTIKGPLQLAITDATQVEMRNAPAEFVCGPQTGPAVAADYAASANAGPGNAGFLRGMNFR